MSTESTRASARYTWERIPDRVAQPDMAWAITISGKRVAFAFEREGDFGFAWCVGAEGSMPAYETGVSQTFERAKLCAETSLRRQVAAAINAAFAVRP